jgi:hypothetical protein
MWEHQCLWVEIYATRSSRMTLLTSASLVFEKSVYQGVTVSQMKLKVAQLFVCYSLSGENFDTQSGT